MKKPPFKVTDEMVSAANAVFMAMAYVQTIRPVIQEIETNLLEKHKYKWDEKAFAKRDPALFIEKYGEYCKDEDMAYLISDKDFGHYLTEKHAAFTAKGFQVKEFGYCPLLVAEEIERKAKGLLIDLMEPVTKFKYDDFFRTTEWKENMEKYIDLTLQLLAPFCKNKLNFVNK